jgi:hypothetical protein
VNDTKKNFRTLRFDQDEDNIPNFLFQFYDISKSGWELKDWIHNQYVTKDEWIQLENLFWDKSKVKETPFKLKESNIAILDVCSEIGFWRNEFDDIWVNFKCGNLKLYKNYVSRQEIINFLNLSL